MRARFYIWIALLVLSITLPAGAATRTWSGYENGLFGLSTNLGFISTNLGEFLHQTGGFTRDKGRSASVLLLNVGGQF